MDQITEGSRLEQSVVIHARNGAASHHTSTQGHPKFIRLTVWKETTAETQTTRKPFGATQQIKGRDGHTANLCRILMISINLTTECSSDPPATKISQDQKIPVTEAANKPQFQAEPVNNGLLKYPTNTPELRQTIHHPASRQITAETPMPRTQSGVTPQIPARDGSTASPSGTNRHLVAW